jgi:hypothetical protein
MDAEKMLGNSYGGIEFQGGEQSIHRVLILYRVDKDHPMGQKGVEVAFEIKKTGRSLGWLIFQMDMGFVRSEYGIDEEGLKKFRFKKS